jgi:hypothetical protein
MRNYVLSFAICAGLASMPLRAGTLLPGETLTITFATSPMPNPDPVQGLLMGWGDLAAVTGSPTFTVSLYNGMELLDTQSTTQPLNFVYWMTWSDTGLRQYGGATVSPTPIDFGPVNAGTFAGRIDITIDQGSVDSILTGDVSSYFQGNQFWDPINIELISPFSDGDGSYGNFAPGINISLNDTVVTPPDPGAAPEPSTVELMGLGVIAFVTWSRRKF